MIIALIVNKGTVCFLPSLSLVLWTCMDQEQDGFIVMYVFFFSMIIES